MVITLLGTGTSQGIPVIGCKCETCLSTDPRDKRLRCSILVKSEEATVVIDAGPDFRAQMLDADVGELDAVLLTHEHNDHIIGLDDLRPLMFTSPNPIFIHAEKRVLAEVKTRFRYAFEKQPYPGAPEFRIAELEVEKQLIINDLSFMPLRLMHGRLPVLGFKIARFAYLTDTNFIPESTLDHLSDLEIIVIDALRQKKHHSHYSLEESLEAIEMIGPKKAFLVHMSHRMGPTSKWEKKLPENVYPGYDGLQFEL